MISISSIIQNSGNLPASEIAEAVNTSLATNDCVVITAPPGAGKSTLLPLTISQGISGEGKVLMLEPRRLAVRQIAERMSNIVGEPVGKSVGYRVRFEKRISDDTNIEVLTEGILTSMLVSDPTLDGVSVVIFDEFHERNMNSDLALALTRQAQQIIRPDLKIVIMSATIDAEGICKALDAPLVESRGRMFPVEVRYSATEPSIPEIASFTATTIRNAHNSGEGDILAFLPGQYEIMKCGELLTGTLGSTSVYPLYGNLSLEQQRFAITPSKAGERKVVLATPIAETSLTIEGVRIVVDSGLCRTLVFEPRTCLSHLETVRISMDMATQRTGRAGRITEGVCYRLWTKATEERMAEQRTPELLEADLSSTILDIAAFGERDIFSLPWLTMPPVASVSHAKSLLQLLGALSEDGSITPLGTRMATMPCHPRISRMILHATTQAQKSIACDIAALLEEKDPLAEDNDTDLCLRISELRRKRNQKSLGRWARIAQIASEYRRFTHSVEENSDVSPFEVGALVAYAYPERIAMAIDNVGNYRLSSGDNVHIDVSDAMTSYHWLAIASLHTQGSSGRVFLASPVNPPDISALSIERENISWDSKLLRVTIQKERRIGKLILESKPIHNADNLSIINIICEAAKKDGLSMFDWNDDVQRLQRRVAQVSLWHPELDIPDISTNNLLQTAKEWLPFYLQQESRIRTSATELSKLNMCEIIWALIPYEQQMEIDHLAPNRITVPTGSHILVDYRLGAEAPVVSVRLQECFGLEDTPRLNDGKQPVLMELLSPGFKPVQLTQDLRSFWSGTYFEVRKELKRRYPKHYWPENPLEAEAVRGVRR